MSQSKPVKLGVIGGSGFYQMEGVDIVKEHTIDTPFGSPSDAVIEAKKDGKTFYFLSRHGRGHRISPSEINYRANIYALKKFGVTHLISVSAAGIMRDSIKPGDLIVPDQIFDRTKGIRNSTFFDDGIVGHVEFADPFSDELRQWLIEAAISEKLTVHDGGTAICMEGPQFSTRAESNFYRQTLNPSVIGMTSVPEAKLAREAEMCYAMLALATDYDCWHESEEDVSVESVLQVLRDNSTRANNVVSQVIKSMPETSSHKDLFAAQFAVITSPDKIAPEVRKRLDLIIGHYLNR